MMRDNTIEAFFALVRAGLGGGGETDGNLNDNLFMILTLTLAMTN